MRCPISKGYSPQLSPIPHFVFVKKIKQIEVTAKDTLLMCNKRKIYICSSNNINLNQWMVKNGWAIAYRYYSRDYVVEEKYASDKKLGIWKSEFIEPYAYRRQNKN